MNSLEKIVNYFRIAPHGIVPAVIGLGLLVDVSIDPESVSELTRFAQSAVGTMGLGCSYWWYSGIKSYKRIKGILKEEGIKDVHLHKHQLFYCDRQAYKAAAYSLGLKEKHDEIANKVPSKDKMFSWMPSF